MVIYCSAGKAAAEVPLPAEVLGLVAADAAAKESFS
jgi:hypothetical protein